MGVRHEYPVPDQLDIEGRKTLRKLGIDVPRPAVGPCQTNAPDVFVLRNDVRIEVWEKVKHLVTDK